MNTYLEEKKAYSETKKSKRFPFFSPEKIARVELVVTSETSRLYGFMENAFMTVFFNFDPERTTFRTKWAEKHRWKEEMRRRRLVQRKLISSQWNGDSMDWLAWWKEDAV